MSQSEALYDATQRQEDLARQGGEVQRLQAIEMFGKLPTKSIVHAVCSVAG